MATPQTTQTGQIVPANGANKPKNKGQELALMLEKMAPSLARALPKHVSAERMGRIALTALRANPKLANCTPGSFLGAVLSAAQLGLEVNTPLGHAYLIPYKDECTLQIGYQGMMDLARRSGSITAIYAYAVYEGDTFSYSLGLNPTLNHVPSEAPDREAKPLTHVYAVAKLRDGEPVFTVLPKSKVELYRNRSKAANDGPWVTDYAAMAMKTAIRRLFTWLPKSAEMSFAQVIDETAESNRPQSSVFDPAVLDAIQGQGLELLPEHTETEPQS
jgi:recombination protein RecT